MIRVAPKIPNPTHHISLEDSRGRKVGLIACDANGNPNPKAIARAPIERTALKTSTGSTKYGDFEPPWSPSAQEDWSGGRGMDDFEKDSTRYLDGMRANTMFGPILHGPQDVYSKGYRSADYSLPGSMHWTALIPGSRKYLAVKFAASASYSAATIALWVLRRGTPISTLTVELCSDSAGNPGTVLQSATVTTGTITDTISVFHHFTITAQALTSGLPYWIKIYPNGSGDDESNCWKVGVTAAAGSTKESAAGSTWAASSVDLYYRVTAADTSTSPLFFRYKDALYMIRNGATGAPTLYLNGDRGVADSNAGNLSTVVDATKNWTVNQWAGAIVMIRAGTGSLEAQPWRKIVSNTATALTVDSPWLIAHDTTSDYVIIKTDQWTTTAIGTHGLTAPVTDVLVINNIVYLACGDGVNIKRMQWNASTGVHDWADDGTNQAVFLEMVHGSTGLEIWRANNSAAPSVSKAAVAAWGANLSFAAATDTTFNDDDGKITGLSEYVDEDNTLTLWIFREGIPYYLVSGKPRPMRLDEMRTMKAADNGKALMVHNVYSYFSLGYGLERYFNSSLDDVGPNRDEGLPAGRQGVISCMVGYPGRFFAGVDAGSGTSSVLAHNGTGWNEIYRAPMPGQRIRAMAFQTIPGEDADRLWVAVGGDVIWLYFPSMTIYPHRDSAYRFHHEAVIESGYHYSGMVDVRKIYNSLKVFAENLSEDERWVEVDYQTDQDTTWTPIDASLFSSPVSEAVFSNEVTGKRLRYRIRSYTADNSQSVRIKGVVLESVVLVPVKYSYSVPFRVVDNDVDLSEKPDEYRYADDKLSVLDEWAEEFSPLTLHCLRGPFDGKRVFINPLPVRPGAEILDKYILTLTAIEL